MMSHERRLPSWRLGVSILELVIVIAIIGIIAALGTPLYVGWRADSLNREAVSVVQQRITVARTDAKRTGSAVAVQLADDATVLQVGGTSIPLPNGGRIDTGGATVTITFEALAGSQSPFQTVAFDVVTGSGAFERSATVNVVPPLGKVGVVR